MKLIVEMEMPTRCCDCDLADGVVCMAKGGVYGREVPKMTWIKTRPSWCPIKGVLPEQHGDLVDADTVLWGEEVPDSEGIVVPVTIGDVIDGYDVQIVIAAERKDDETTAD